MSSNIEQVHSTYDLLYCIVLLDLVNYALNASILHIHSRTNNGVETSKTSQRKGDIPILVNIMASTWNLINGASGSNRVSNRGYQRGVIKEGNSNMPVKALRSTSEWLLNTSGKKPHLWLLSFQMELWMFLENVHRVSFEYDIIKIYTYKNNHKESER